MQKTYPIGAFALVACASLSLAAHGTQPPPAQPDRSISAPGADAVPLPAGRLHDAGGRGFTLGTCAVYDDPVEFETDAGPFRRDLDNYEDFELTNAPDDGACLIASPESLDCNRHDDASGLCPGPSVDAGDILTGLEIGVVPTRTPGWWHLLVAGSPGWADSRLVMPNWFGDSLTLSFPNSAVPVGCEAAAPGPNALGMRVETTVTVRLGDGSELGFGPSASGFLGVCCDQEILSAQVGVDHGIDDVRWANVPCVRAPDRGRLYRGVVPDLAPGWKEAALALTAANDEEAAPFPAATSLGAEFRDELAASGPLVLYRFLLGGFQPAGNELRAVKSAAVPGAVDIRY